jgi:hypothetical protein
MADIRRVNVEVNPISYCAKTLSNLINPTIQLKLLAVFLANRALRQGRL